MNNQQLTTVSVRELKSNPVAGDLLAWLCLILLTLAGVRAQAQGLEPETQGRVSFVSGGVGQEEVCQLKGMQHDYNLRVLFAETPSNHYLADIPVKIVDRRGATVLDTTSKGPYLYARLAPGNYRILAENGDRTLSRSVHISGARPTSVSLFWRGTEQRSQMVRVDSLPHC